jgi:hypothetical protein
MGTTNKENVQFVISHLEGCSGNFLGYLIADTKPSGKNIFRTDTDLNSQVLSINGRGLFWDLEIDKKLISHTVVVTHNYDRDQIQNTFPAAKLIQIYPYTHIGNVLYNICYKKLSIKLDNVIDNHFLDIRIWANKIELQNPEYLCNNYWDLTDKIKIQQFLGSKLTETQHHFFDQYWSTQLPVELNMPDSAMKILELVDYWQIQSYFSPWMVAWAIFVYEHKHNLLEHNRQWTINNATRFNNWEELAQIESQYDCK